MKTHNGHRVHGALRRAVCLGLALVAPLALAAEPIAAASLPLALAVPAPLALT